MWDQSEVLHDRKVSWLVMSVIKCDCADDADSNEQWRETVNSSADQIHESQSRLKSIWMLTETVTFVTDVRQAHEQYDDDDDQNDTVYWVKLIRLWYVRI